MKCQEVKQKIYTYLDRCLNSREESALVSHLSHCDSCQKELQDARRLNQLLENSYTRVQPPSDFVSQVMNRIEEFEKKSIATTANVIPLREHSKEKRSIWEKLVKSSFSFSKVASFTAIIVAISAVVAFSNIPEMTKMANLGHKLSGLPIVGKDKTPGSIQMPDSTNDTKPGVKVEVEDLKPTTGTSEQEEPDGEQENVPEQDPAVTDPEESTETSNSPQTPPQTSEEPPSGEEAIPELPPRLDGPIRQVTGVTSVVAKSVSLTPISTDSNYDSIKPAWDEKGKKVYYFSTQEADRGNYTLWAKSLNDSTAEIMARNVTKQVNIDKPQSQSPNGEYKLYQEQGQVFVAKIDGSQATPLTPKLDGASFTYAWKPDGKSVAINVKGTENQGLWIADAQGTTWSLITTNGGGTSLSWSPDGQKIAFTDRNNMIYVGILVAENKTNLLMVVPEGDKQGDVTLAWSSDSQRLLFDWAKDGSNRGVYLATIPN
jgi:hypothetical protein